MDTGPMLENQSNISLINYQLKHSSIDGGPCSISIRTGQPAKTNT